MYYTNIFLIFLTIKIYIYRSLKVNSIEDSIPSEIGNLINLEEL